MQLEVGEIYEGKITGVKKFGAFVRLPSGTTGMVHISEVSNEYIQELEDVLGEGQTVKVKVMSISPEGKVALSMKRVEGNVPPASSGGGRSGGRQGQNGGKPQRGGPGGRADPGRVWQPKASQQPAGQPTFEDLMSKFKTQSEEKISDLKRVTEARRGGGYSRRR